MTLLNIGSMTRRVLRWYDMALPEHVREGMTWYMGARRFTAGLAANTPYTLEQIAGVVAVLSPQVNWAHNQKAAVAIVGQHVNGDTSAVLPNYSGYKANVEKACRVLAGDLSAVGGPKVTAFYKAIIGDLSMVTVDVWATRAARATERNMAFAFCDDETPGVKEHRAIAEAYRRAAAHRGIAPAQMQAVVWTAIRASDVWRKPQHMSEVNGMRFYRRQMAARARQGVTVALQGRWYYDNAPRKQRAAQEAMAV